MNSSGHVTLVGSEVFQLRRIVWYAEVCCIYFVQKYSNYEELCGMLRYAVFILSTSVSYTSSATPRTVALGKFSSSWLKFASITYTLLSDVSVSARACCDVNRVVSRARIPTLKSARAESTP
jgi:hypothetical protein